MIGNIKTDKAPSEATFRGSEFLSYDLGQTGGEPIVSAQDAISLYFRTRQPNGLLFYTSKQTSRVDTKVRVSYFKQYNIHTQRERDWL